MNFYLLCSFLSFRVAKQKKETNQRKKVHAEYKSKILALNKETDKLGICNVYSVIKSLRQYPLLVFRLCFRLYYVVLRTTITVFVMINDNLLFRL